MQYILYQPHAFGTPADYERMATLRESIQNVRFLMRKVGDVPACAAPAAN